MSAAGDGVDFSKCKLVAMSALQLTKPCGADSGCGFNGFWGGNVEALQPKFYLMSYLYERAEQARAGKGQSIGLDFAINRVPIGDVSFRSFH